MTPSRLPPCQTQHAARLEHARELGEHAAIVGRLGEEAERREQIEHGVEAAGPRAGSARMSPRVYRRRVPVPALSRAREQVARVVEAIDVEAGFGEQMRVASLAARHVEHARAGRKAEHVDEARDLATIALERKERLVLEQILRVEVALPPFGGVANASASR